MFDSSYKGPDILSKKGHILKELELRLQEYRLIDERLIFSRESLRRLEKKIEKFMINEPRECSHFLKKHLVHFLFYIGDTFLNSVHDAKWVLVIEDSPTGETYYNPMIQIKESFNISRFEGVLNNALSGIEVEHGELPSLTDPLSVLEIEYESYIN